MFLSILWSSIDFRDSRASIAACGKNGSVSDGDFYRIVL